MPFVPEGMPAHLDYPSAVVGDALRGSAERFPQNVAVSDGELRFTYSELCDAAMRVAGGLRALGVERGQTVALHMPNSAWFSVAYYGVMLAGAVATPLNPSLPAGMVRDQLDQTGAVAAFVHPTTREIMRVAASERLRHTVVVPTTTAAPGEPVADDDAVPLETLLAADPFRDRELTPDDPAHVAFTGGTTGRSKAIDIRHRNVLSNAIQVACMRTGSVPGVTPDGAVVLDTLPKAVNDLMDPVGTSTVIGLAPMFHTMGLVSQTCNILVGAELMVLGRFDPNALADIIEQRGVSSVPGSPALFHALLAVPGIEQRDFSSVKMVFSGAAPIESATLSRLGRLFPNAVMAEGYGLTEATMGVAQTPLAPAGTAPPGAVGCPLFDTELQIRALEDGSVLPPNEIGQVWVRGPQVTAGYLDQPEATAEQFVDGWLHTGDLGRVDEDGWLYLSGRSKDMVIYKGYNVYPSALEGVLIEHDAVAQVSVIGVPTPQVGERPVAFVVLAPGWSASDELATDLQGFVAERVPPYSKVREIVFVGELPTSAAGKILKNQLRENYRDLRGGSPA